MPRMTKKYTETLRTGRKVGIRTEAGDQEWLYQMLSEQGYQWDADAGQWQHLPSLPADEPSNLIRVRVWAEANIVGLMADGIIESMLAAGLRLVERSQPYPCRPPQQRASRVYLTFEPEVR